MLGETERIFVIIFEVFQTVKPVHAYSFTKGKTLGECYFIENNQTVEIFHQVESKRADLDGSAAIAD